MGTAVFFIFSSIPVPVGLAATNELTLNDAQRPVPTLTLEQANAQTVPAPQNEIPSGVAVQNSNPLSLGSPNLQAQGDPIPEGALEVHPGDKIQDAIEQAEAGDIIYVHAGTYHESITLKEGVNLRGENSETTIIHGDYVPGASVIRALGKNTIENLTVTGARDELGQTPAAGIKIEGDQVHVRKNKILFNLSAGIYVSGNGSDILIEANLFRGNPIAIKEPKTGNTIAYNTITGYEAEQSIQLTGLRYRAGQGIQLEIRDPQGAYAYYIEYSNDCGKTWVRARVQDPLGDLLVLADRSEASTFWMDDGSATSPGPFDVSGRWYRVRIAESFSSKIGIQILNGQAPAVRNNILAHQIVQSIWEETATPALAVEGNVLFHNTEKGDATGQHLPPAISPKTGEGWTGGNVLADPQFVDAANEDYSVPETSPAFGRGAFLPEVLISALDRAFSVHERSGATYTVEEIRSNGELTGWRFVYSEGFTENFYQDGTYQIFESYFPNTHQARFIKSYSATDVLLVMSEYNAAGVLVNTTNYAYHASGRLESKTLLNADTDGNFYYHYEDTAANLCDWAKRQTANAEGEIAFSYFYHPGTSVVQYKDAFSDVARTQRLMRYEYDASGVLIAKTNAKNITSYFNAADGALERVAIEPAGSTDPLPSIEIVRPVITQFANSSNSWTIKFDRAMKGVRYQVQFRTSLMSNDWQPEGLSFVADQYGEISCPDPMADRGNTVYYRIVAQEMTTAADLLTQINLLYFDPAFGMIETTHEYPVEGWLQKAKTQPSNFGFYAYLLATIAAGDLVTSKISKTEAISRLNTMMDHLLVDQADQSLAFMGLFPWFEYTGSDWIRMSGDYGQQVSFEDNTNFTNALAVAYGALLDESLSTNTTIHGAGGILGKINTFIENQRAGYLAMYNGATNTFSRTMKIQDHSLSGTIDYFGAESSAPLLFLILQYGNTFPASAYAKLNFSTHSYTMQDLTTRQVVAPFSGAFQMYWPALLMPEFTNPDLKKMLETYTDVQLDFADRNEQPGFLSASFDVQAHDLLQGPVVTFNWAGDMTVERESATRLHVTSTDNRGIGVAFVESGMDVSGLTLLLNYSSHTPILGAKIDFKKKYGNDLVTVLTINLTLENTGGALRTAPINLPAESFLNDLDEIVFATGSEAGGPLDMTIRNFHVMDGSYEIVYNFPLGIKEIAFDQSFSVETTPSVYNLGAAHMFRPAEVEALLQELIANHRDLVSDHGLWEGKNMNNNLVVTDQVFNNNATFILGMTGTGPDYMTRYLENKGLAAKLESIWNSQTPVSVIGQKPASNFNWDAYKATSWKLSESVRASDRQIRITYQSDTPITGAKFELKHSWSNNMAVYSEPFVLPATGGVPKEFIFTIPADALYWNISEMVVSFPEAQGFPSAKIRRIIVAPAGVPSPLAAVALKAAPLIASSVEIPLEPAIMAQEILPSAVSAAGIVPQTVSLPSSAPRVSVKPSLKFAAADFWAAQRRNQSAKAEKEDTAGMLEAAILSPSNNKGSDPSLGSSSKSRKKSSPKGRLPFRSESFKRKVIPAPVQEALVLTNACGGSLAGTAFCLLGAERIISQD